MGNRLTRIYTRTGDDGTTGLADGTRIAKSSPRLQAMGDIDELNSLVGLLLARDISDDLRDVLSDVQHALFDAGGELSLPDQSLISSEYVSAAERLTDHYNARLPALKEFILPGGTETAAICHLARAVCRRAERSMIRLNESEQLNRETLIYLNRLSDLLFVLARVLAKADGGTEVYWEKGRLQR